MSCAVNPADASNGVPLGVLRIGLADGIEGRTAGIDLMEGYDQRAPGTIINKKTYFSGLARFRAMRKMFLKFLIRDHVGKPVRERGITETPVLLLEFEVGVHGEVKRVEPTSKQYISSTTRNTSGINGNYLSTCGDTRFFPGWGHAGHSTERDPGASVWKPPET
jgi:hypothetical protein